MATVLILEPYLARSHRDWLEGLRAHSRHRVEALTMPARKWKWRMRGSALHFADLLAGRRPPDVLVATDFLNLAELAGVGPAWLRHVPTLLYFHENQLTYPLPDEADRDYQFAFTHLTSCLAADRVAFNSAYHRNEFLAALAALVRRMPDLRPTAAVERVRARSVVLPLGCDFTAFHRAAAERAGRCGPLRILWNHRWEWDKDPEAFFEVLFDLADGGHPFRLCVVGEQFRTAPAVFALARQRLAERIDHWGFVSDRSAYAGLVCSSDVAVSTARHEFFGLAAVEAMAAGLYPLLPSRLTYPELLPADLHARHLYGDAGDLRERLAWCIRHVAEVRATDVSPAARRFAWPAVIQAYDAELDALLTAGTARWTSPTGGVE